MILPDFDSFHKINILIFTQNKQCCEKRIPPRKKTAQKATKKGICFVFFLMNQTTDVKTPRDSVTLKAYKSGSSSSSRL